MSRLDEYIKRYEGLHTGKDDFRASTTGQLIKAPNTGVPMQSPYLAIANKQAQIMTKAAVEMGFTPASRSRITQPTDTQIDLDPWADIAG